jgi:hypothetical protein
MCTANAIRTGLVGSTAREAAGSAWGGPGLETSAPRPVRSAGGPRFGPGAGDEPVCKRQESTATRPFRLGQSCFFVLRTVASRYTVETPRIEFTGT